MIIGLLVLAYALVVYFIENDKPMVGMFVMIVGGPALMPAILGYKMSKGSVPAAWTLRAVLIAVLIGGTFLDLVIGLDVFSFAPVAVSLITVCVVWLVLSFL